MRAHLSRVGGNTAEAERWYAAAPRPAVPAGEPAAEEFDLIAGALLGELLRPGVGGVPAEQAETMAAAAAGIADPVAYLEALGMRSIPHGSRQADLSAGTFMDHLVGVEAAMRVWELPETLCMAGLFHSVYGTQGYGYYTLPLSQRAKVVELIGARGEAAVFYNCVMDRSSLDE